MKAYQLRVSAEQAQAIQAACELMARIMIGQSHEIARHLPLTDPAEQWSVGCAIEAITKPACGLSINESLGVGHYNHANLLFDLAEVIRHQISWDQALAKNLLTPSGGRDYSTMGGVCFDPPMHWNRHQPLAKIEAIE